MFLKRLQTVSWDALEARFAGSYSIRFSLPGTQRKFNIKIPPVESKHAKHARILEWAVGAVIFALLLLPSLYYLYQLAIPSFPVWLCAGVLQFANLHLFRYRKTRQFLPDTLASVTAVDVNGKRLEWKLDTSSIRARTNPDHGMIGGSLAVIGLTGLVLWFQYGRGSFDALVWDIWLVLVDIPSPVSVTLCAILAAGVLLFVHLSCRIRDRVRSSLQDKVRPIVDDLNSRIEQSAAEFATLTLDVQRLSSQLQISFLAPYQSELHAVLELHKADVVANPDSLVEHLQQTLERARTDRTELQKARDAFQAADVLFTQSSEEVNKTSLVPLIRELDQLFHKLTSPDVKTLLEAREWENYHQVVGEVAEDMKRLRELTEKCLPPEEEKSSPAPVALLKETATEKAFRLLRLPENAGREHTQKAYRWLAAVWHPDSGIVTDDTEIKEINWAYDFLMTAKKLKS